MTPTPYTDAVRFTRQPLDPDQRGDTEALALRLATDRTGAAFGEAGALARLVCALGAEREALQARIDTFLTVWERPYLTKGHWSSHLEQAVRALRGDA